MHDIHQEDKKDLCEMIGGVAEVPEPVAKRYFAIRKWFDKRGSGPLGPRICAQILADTMREETNEPKPLDIDLSELGQGAPVLFTRKGSKPREGEFIRLDGDHAVINEKGLEIRVQAVNVTPLELAGV